MKPLVDKKYKLEKYPGKGGWTFARIPEVMQDKNKPFGWVKVRGTIDGYEIKKYNLAPMGDGKLFLPVRAEIRKKINKKEEDNSREIPKTGNDTLKVPEKVMISVQDEQKAFSGFQTHREAEQKHYIACIDSAMREETKVKRLAGTIIRQLI